MCKITATSQSRKPEIEGDVKFTKEPLYQDGFTKSLVKFSFSLDIEIPDRFYNREAMNELIAEKLKQDFLAYVNSQ